MFEFLFFIYCSFLGIVVIILWILDKFGISFIIMLIGTAFGFKLYISNEKKKKKLEEQHKLFLLKLNNIIFKHRAALASEKDKLTIVDSYGCKNYDEWFTKGIIYFTDRVLIMDLTDNERDWVRWNKDYVYKQIDSIAETELESIKKRRFPQVYNDNMTGIEYELFCKGILEQNNWTISTTKISGDHGVDLIAKQGNVTVAIQCKRSSSRVGNKAVQEIVAGANHYNTQYAIVVSNTLFTPQAKMLASTNSVFLLHHNDLHDLFDIIKKG